METARLATDPARTRLLAVADTHGLERVRDAIDGLDAALGADLAAVESALAALGAGGNVAAAAARHLVRAGGKRVRPALCVLASRACGARANGAGGLTVRSLAAVAEAVHAATLLHDDVIDLGEMRRGALAARAVYGNAASVLGGDLLLVRGLALLEGLGLEDLLARLLGVLVRMVEAEALQLVRRGKAAVTAEEYFAIVEGKTASLFEWAAEAGARAGGAAPGDPRALALARYGREVGVAFQVQDDLLDLEGDPARLGKGVLADLREGKVTFPLIHALRADPGLAAPLEAAARGEVDDLHGLFARVRAAVRAGGGDEAARAEVEARTGRALGALEALPPSVSRAALEAVAHALAERAV